MHQGNRIGKKCYIGTKNNQGNKMTYEKLIASLAFLEEEKELLLKTDAQMEEKFSGEYRKLCESYHQGRNENICEIYLHLALFTLYSGDHSIAIRRDVFHLECGFEEKSSSYKVSFLIT